MAFDSLSVGGDLTRGHALEQLLAPGRETARDCELVVNAVKVTRTDVVTAAATRMRIQRHMREHPAGSVTIWPPEELEVARRLRDLLDPLPPRVQMPDTPTGGTGTLLPATVVTDREDARLVGNYVLWASERARVALRRARLISTMTMELADNAVRHAPAGADHPVVAVSIQSPTKIVELAVVDSGTGYSDSPDAAAGLRAIVEHAASGQGLLGDILALAAPFHGTFSLAVFSGTGRLSWERTSHRTTRGRYVPGTTFVVRFEP